MGRWVVRSLGLTDNRSRLTDSNYRISTLVVGRRSSVIRHPSSVIALKHTAINPPRARIRGVEVGAIGSILQGAPPRLTRMSPESKSARTPNPRADLETTR